MTTTRGLAAFAVAGAAVLAGCSAHHDVEVSPTEAFAGGEITGQFLAVGGPSGAPTEAQHGHLIVREQGRTVKIVPVPQDGGYDFAIQPGRYTIVGLTSQFTINNHKAPCESDPPTVIVRVGHMSLVNVYCQRR